jgi:hypothetical protein
MRVLGTVLVCASSGRLVDRRSNQRIDAQRQLTLKPEAEHVNRGTSVGAARQA